uniref:Uncharacterized protein n=1 Tax=Cacopsylla melanoneura TaxID=428564 RepID=A0A8D8Y836_9HEMI
MVFMKPYTILKGFGMNESRLGKEDNAEVGACSNSFMTSAPMFEMFLDDGSTWLLITMGWIGAGAGGAGAGADVAWFIVLTRFGWIVGITPLGIGRVGMWTVGVVVSTAKGWGVLSGAGGVVGFAAVVFVFVITAGGVASVALTGGNVVLTAGVVTFNTGTGTTTVSLGDLLWMNEYSRRSSCSPVSPSLSFRV